MWGFWGFYSSVEPTLISWWRRYFLVGEIFINIHNLWDDSLTGIPIIMVERGAQDISILESLETTHATWLPCRCIGWHVASTNRLLFIHSLKSTYPSPYLSILVMNLSIGFVRPTLLSFLVTSSLKSDSVNSIRLPWDLPLSHIICIVLMDFFFKGIWDFLKPFDDKINVFGDFECIFVSCK